MYERMSSLIYSHISINALERLDSTFSDSAEILIQPVQLHFEHTYKKNKQNEMTYTVFYYTCTYVCSFCV